MSENAHRLIVALFDDFIRHQSEILWQPRKRDELHAFRKAGKPLRYAMEIFSVCFGSPFEARLTETKQLLELLGSTHDCDVAIVTTQGYLIQLRTYNRQLTRPGDRISTSGALTYLRELRREREAHFFSMCVMLEQWRLNNFRRQLIESMELRRQQA